MPVALESQGVLGWHQLQDARNLGSGGAYHLPDLACWVALSLVRRRMHELTLLSPSRQDILHPGSPITNLLHSPLLISTC